MTYIRLGDYDVVPAAGSIDDSSVSVSPPANKQTLARTIGLIGGSGVTSVWRVGDSVMNGSNPGGGVLGFVGVAMDCMERVLRGRRSDIDFVGSQATQPELATSMGCVWNDCHPGEKIEDATTNFAARLAACYATPKLVVFHLGTNNISTGDSAATMDTKFRAWCALYFAAVPDGHVIVVPPNIVDGSNTHANLAAWQAVATAYRALLATYAASEPRIEIADVMAGFSPGEYLDGAHLNRSGAEAFGAGLADAIDAYLGRPARRGKTLPRTFRERLPQYSIAIPDGTLAKLSLAGASGHNITAASHAIAFDYYFTSLAAGFHSIVENGPYNDASTWFGIFQNAAGLYVYWNNAGGTIVSGACLSALQLNRWHRIVVLAYRDGANSCVGLYVNGRLVGIATGLPAWSASTQTITLGKGPTFNAPTGYTSRLRTFRGAGVPKPGTMAAQIAVEDDYYLDGPIAQGYCTAHHDLDGILSDDVYGGAALTLTAPGAAAAFWPNAGGSPRRPWEQTADYPGTQFVSDSDVATAAAIAGSKIAPDFGAQTVTTTGTVHGGVVTAGAGTPAASGSVRVASNVTALTARTAGGADNDLVATDGSDDLLLGDATDTPIVATRSTTNFQAQVGGSAKLVVGTTTTTVSDDLTVGSSGPRLTKHAGSPESAVAAPVGSICMDTTNGDLYVKNTGTGNTGWKLVVRVA